MSAKVEGDLLALLDEGQRKQMWEIIDKINFNELDKRVSQELSWIRRDLHLSEEEVDRCYPVYLSYHVARDEYMRNLRVLKARGQPSDHQQVWRYVQRLDEEKVEKLRSILGDERVVKLKEFEKRRWGGFRPPKPPGPPRPAPANAGSKCPPSKDAPAP